MVPTHPQVSMEFWMDIKRNKEIELNDRDLSSYQMNELAFYTLAGAPETPRDLIEAVSYTHLTLPTKA